MMSKKKYELTPEEEAELEQEIERTRLYLETVRMFSPGGEEYELHMKLARTAARSRIHRASEAAGSESCPDQKRTLCKKTCLHCESDFANLRHIVPPGGRSRRHAGGATAPSDFRP